MPHMCTRCRSVFEDGMDVLEGCPVCGWNKFLFVKSKDKIMEVRGAFEASDISGPREPWPESDGSLRNKIKKAPSRDLKTDRPGEGRKEGTARSEKPSKRAKGTLGFVDLDSKKDRSKPPEDEGFQKQRIDEDKTLESIRMPEPGTYELNLSSLFERDELVMAVKEGTYFIDLSSAFKKPKKS